MMREKRLHVLEIKGLRGLDDQLGLFVRQELLRRKPGLTDKEWTKHLKHLKRLPVWPRVALDLYEAELPAAQKRKKGNPAGEHGTPRDIAYAEVGKAIGVKADRVHALVKKGRRQRRAVDFKFLAD
jgi:hypothetical protein